MCISVAIWTLIIFSNNLTRFLGLEFCDTGHFSKFLRITRMYPAFALVFQQLHISVSSFWVFHKHLYVFLAFLQRCLVSGIVGKIRLKLSRMSEKSAKKPTKVSKNVGQIRLYFSRAKGRFDPIKVGNFPTIWLNKLGHLDSGNLCKYDYKWRF